MLGLRSNYAGTILKRSLFISTVSPAVHINIRQKNRVFRGRSSNQTNLKAAAFRFSVHKKCFENGAFLKYKSKRSGNSCDFKFFQCSADGKNWCVFTLIPPFFNFYPSAKCRQAIDSRENNQAINQERSLNFLIVGHVNSNSFNNEQVWQRNKLGKRNLDTTMSSSCDGNKFYATCSLVCFCGYFIIRLVNFQQASWIFFWIKGKRVRRGLYDICPEEKTELLIYLKNRNNGT